MIIAQCSEPNGVQDQVAPLSRRSESVSGGLRPISVGENLSLPIWKMLNGSVLRWHDGIEVMTGWLKDRGGRLEVTAALLVSVLLGAALQGCAAQTAVQTWEGRQDSVQQTRRSAGPRTEEREGAARAALQHFHAVLFEDDPFDPSLLAQHLSLSISERSGRFSPTSPEFVTLRPIQQDTPITSALLMLKPVSGRVFRGSETRISLSSERFGCVTLADVTATFGGGYEPARKLPFQPSWPVEIPIDVALYRVDGPPRRTVSFNYQFLDCLGSIEVLELLQ